MCTRRAGMSAHQVSTLPPSFRRREGAGGESTGKADVTAWLFNSPRMRFAVRPFSTCGKEGEGRVRLPKAAKKPFIVLQIHQ